MMIVYTFGPAWGSADLSPFCVKLQTWLRMAGLAYEPRIGNIRKLPKGKLPALELDGTILTDSTQIIEHLQQRHGDPLRDGARSPVELAVARAMRGMIESELYFANLYQRWAGDANFRIVQPTMANYAMQVGAPAWLAPTLMRSARRQMMRQLDMQGMGRHNAAEIAQIGISGYRAISDFLDNKVYMLGAEPSTLDATAFAFLHTLLIPPFASPIKDYVASRSNLVEYHDRMLARWWPELRQNV